MNEFMLLIRNRGASQSGMSSDAHLEFVNKCKLYIEKLQREGKLISAQPLAIKGAVISKNGNAWKVEPISESAEIQVGYYHIFAANLEEAIIMAKDNPEFEYNSTASIEVRPIKVKEEQNQFVYPVKK